MADPTISEMSSNIDKLEGGTTKHFVTDPNNVAGHDLNDFKAGAQYVSLANKTVRLTDIKDNQYTAPATPITASTMANTGGFKVKIERLVNTKDCLISGVILQSKITTGGGDIAFEYDKKGIIPLVNDNVYLYKVYKAVAGTGGYADKIVNYKPEKVTGGGALQPVFTNAIIALMNDLNAVGAAYALPKPQMPFAPKDILNAFTNDFLKYYRINGMKQPKMRGGDDISDKRVFGIWKRVNADATSANDKLIYLSIKYEDMDAANPTLIAEWKDASMIS